MGNKKPEFCWERLINIKFNTVQIPLMEFTQISLFVCLFLQKNTDLQGK